MLIFGIYQSPIITGRWLGWTTSDAMLWGSAVGWWVYYLSAGQSSVPHLAAEEHSALPFFWLAPRSSWQWCNDTSIMSLPNYFLVLYFAPEPATVHCSALWMRVYCAWGWGGVAQWRRGNTCPGGNVLAMLLVSIWERGGHKYLKRGGLHLLTFGRPMNKSTILLKLYKLLTMFSMRFICKFEKKENH